MQKKALITGGLGFVGYHLSRRLLAEGFQVVALDNLQRGRIDKDVALLQAERSYNLVIGNLLTGDPLPGIGSEFTHVFHLAAIVGVKNVVSQPYRVLQENVLTLSRVLEWSRTQSHLRRFMFSSTSEVYAGTLEAFGLPIPTPEKTPLTVAQLNRPRTAYMLSKIYGEALCQFADLPFTIVRLHNVYGPRMGMAHVVPELLQRAWQAPPSTELVVFSPSHARTFCYVADAVELLVRLALTPAAECGTFNVGAQQEEISILDLARLVTSTIGKTLRLVPGPDTEGSPKRRKADLTHAIVATGYIPRVPIIEGLNLTWEWYRNAIAEAGTVAETAD